MGRTQSRPASRSSSSSSAAQRSIIAKQKQQHDERAHARAERARSLATSKQLEAQKCHARLHTKRLTKAAVKKMTVAQIRKELADKKKQKSLATANLAEATKDVTPKFVELVDTWSTVTRKAWAVKQVSIVHARVRKVKTAASRYEYAGGGSSGGYCGYGGVGKEAEGMGGGGGSPPDGDDPGDMSLDECEKELEDEVGKLMYVTALVEVHELTDEVAILEAELARREAEEQGEAAGAKGKAKGKKTAAATKGKVSAAKGKVSATKVAASKATKGKAAAKAAAPKATKGKATAPAVAPPMKKVVAKKRRGSGRMTAADSKGAMATLMGRNFHAQSMLQLCGSDF